MLSIVAYSSDESDDDNDSTETSTISVGAEPKVKLAEAAGLSGSKKDGDIERSDYSDPGSEDLLATKRASLFASLPAPKQRTVKAAIISEFDLESEQDICQSDVGGPLASKTEEEFRPGQGKTMKSVKITVPSLSEFTDDSEATVKRRRITTGSSLLSSLPSPKNVSTKTTNRLLIPYTLSKKPITNRTPPSHTTVKSTIDSASDDSNDESEAPVDFFSLDKVGKNVVDCNVEAAEPQPTSSLTNSQQSEDENVSSRPLEPDYSVPSSCADAGFYYSQVPSADDPQALLQDAGFLRLRGKRRGNEDIQFIDVSQDDQLPNTEEWLTKSLSEETVYRPSRKNGHMPTSQQRRKHQITYLAFQAKEREQELKNQWAQNRQTKYQTQSKYGF